MKAINILFGSLILGGASLLVLYKMNLKSDSTEENNDVSENENAVSKNKAVSPAVKARGVSDVAIGNYVESKSVNGINLREKPSTNSKIIGKDFKGVIGKVISTSKQKDGVWLQVKLDKPMSANSFETKTYDKVFVRSDVVKAVSYITSNGGSIKVPDISKITKF